MEAADPSNQQFIQKEKCFKTAGFMFPVNRILCHSWIAFLDILFPFRKPNITHTHRTSANTTLARDSKVACLAPSPAGCSYTSASQIHRIAPSGKLLSPGTRRSNVGKGSHHSTASHSLPRTEPRGTQAFRNLGEGNTK